MRLLGELINKKIITDQVFGLEVELEAKENYEYPSLPFWRKEFDGSLRGNSIEYVTKTPANFHKTIQKINSLYDTIDMPYINRGSKRTSTHVHINATDMTLAQIMSVVILYFVFENDITKLCGKHRVGNMYALRLIDAEKQITDVLKCFNNNSIHDLFRQSDRYTALNLNALHKFGTLEFRAMRGCPEVEVVCHWIKILNDLVSYARRYNNPFELLKYIIRTPKLDLGTEVFGQDLFNIGYEYDNNVMGLFAIIMSQELTNELVIINRKEQEEIGHPEIIWEDVPVGNEEANNRLINRPNAPYPNIDV